MSHPLSLIPQLVGFPLTLLGLLLAIGSLIMRLVVPSLPYVEIQGVLTLDS